MQQFTHGKGQELSASDQLLDRLELAPSANTIVTTDALHTNRNYMEKIVVEKGADYLTQVKENTPRLLQCAENAFARKTNQIQSAENLTPAHGRIEVRKLDMVPLSPVESGWPHTQVVCRVERDRRVLRRCEVVDHGHEVAYYVASFPADSRDPFQALQLVRQHWGIENELHHPKDRSMDEDRCRASEKGVGRTLSCIRGLVAQISRRTNESLGVIQFRFARRPQLLLKMLESPSLAEWEKRCTPYKTG